jgi:hypothetical protein
LPALLAVKERVALWVQMPLAVLRGLSALMQSDVLCESSECDFRAALRLNRLIAQTSEIDARLP